MVDTSTNPGVWVMTIVPNRIRETLIPIIQAHTRPGTIIYSDDFSTYRTVVGQLPNVVQHSIVNHSLPNVPTSCKRKLYVSLMLPHLSYCSPIWHPTLVKDIMALERIQRRATKFILSDYSSTYKSRLTSLNLLPLMYQLELNDILFFISCIKDPSYKFPLMNYFSFSTSSTCSNSFYKLNHISFVSTLHHNSYVNRLPRLWNALPIIDISKSLTKIKSDLKNHFWNHFITHFNPENFCYHYLCTCNRCQKSPRSTNFSIFT